MKQLLSTIIFCVAAPFFLFSQSISYNGNIPTISYEEQALITPASEGLWSIATGWENDWMTDWSHANPTHIEYLDNWTILTGSIVLPEGEMLLRDSYSEVDNGLIKCVRRFEWKGPDTLRNATLSVRFRMEGSQLKPFLPGILYYGNKMGAKVNPDIIPVYTGHAGEFAIFEDHRYPMPFAMLENVAEKYAAAIHTTPSPVKGAVLNDQWWSMGVEAYDGYTEFVLYSGPIGYNGQRSVAKALQRSPMKYSNTYLTLEPGSVIEKEFYLELYPIEREGTGFQCPLYTSLDLHKPYNVDRFESFDNIVESKYRFAQTRWIDGGDICGFGMYDLSLRKDLVMGWCGQADSPDYALKELAGI